MGYLIRSFKPADQAAVRALILAGMGQRWGWIDETANPDIDAIADTYCAAGHTVLVAEENGHIIGTGTLLNESATIGRIVRVSVADTHQRRGIGRAISQRLVEIGRAKKLHTMLVETNVDWDSAIQLYKQCGFAEVERKDGEVHFVLKLG